MNIYVKYIQIWKNTNHKLIFIFTKYNSDYIFKLLTYIE